ncbi:MAG: MATE family efflux transporter, partial [Erysipelotrichaceae bacterium]|nr:MATE family efflux transporter [Erysipelotrichaceae bacterium]
WKSILLFALPLMIGSLFQQLYNTVDTVIVGNFVGRQALAAVGSTDPIINTFIGMFLGLSNGAGVVIAQYFGADDEENVARAVGTSLALTAVLAVVCTIAALLLLPNFMQLLGTPDDVWDEAYSYLSIYLGGMTGLLFYNMGAGILRAVGDSKRPLYFLVLSAVLNIVLDLLFVVGFKWGAAGAAVATVLTQFIAAFLVFYVLMRDKGCWRVRIMNIRFHKGILKKVLFVGMPSAFQLMVTNFSNVLIQSYINAFGSTAMAGWSVYNKLDKLCLLPIQSIGLSVTTFTGQNLGAGNEQRARRGIRAAIAMALIISAAIIVPMILCAPELTRLFNQDPEIVLYGTRILRTIMPIFWIVCFHQLLTCALQGAGNTRVSVTILMFCFIIFRQAYLLILSQFDPSFEQVIFGYPAGWILCSVLITLYYRKTDLMKTVVTRSRTKAGGPRLEQPAA